MLKRAALAALLALAPLAALAHGPAKGPNGGQMQDVGTLHVELVAADGVLRLFVTDADDKPVALEGAGASATVLAAGKTEKVALAPEGAALVGRGAFPAAKGLRVVVVLAVPGKSAGTARFAPLDP